MKKTLTVNLGGTVYHIDEDAYRLLDNYLANLKIHFRQERGADEIIKDIEYRISELFSEKISSGYQVITLDDVEQIIGRMGKPEDWEEGAEKADSGEPSGKQQDFSRDQIHRRLYRNPDNRIVGGVAGGIAAYMGWDPTLVRIAMILLLFAPYFSIVLIYIIAWILIPLATTATEKLAMKGENVTVENIGKTVTDSFDRVADGVNNYIKSGKPRSAAQKMGDVIVQVVGILLKVFLIFIAIVLIPVLFVMAIVFITLILVAFGVFTAIPGMLINYYPVADWTHIGSFPTALLGIAGVLLAGIPLFSLIYLAFKSIFNWRQMSPGWKWALLIIWFIALGCVAGACHWINLLGPGLYIR